uniref:NADH:ubiquinone reductase (H(+)-translocating) n=1 Tax=Romanomermis culicivorax TaxID=13658 RepID=A1EHG0_ROMCU|nr:NADH dehydrogenase subunit 5 [Romanomermis culicivorax]ABL11589.1 NADH dehydrogenase subunit 5 [Romanomermis culicivorax]
MFMCFPLITLKLKIAKINQFLNMEINISLFSLIFMISLMLIFKNILMFSNIYMMKNLSFNYFKILMWLFCLSMIMLLVSENFLTLILSWEFLGITSYMLILFYYNWNSLSGSKLTFISNRIGDTFIMIMLFLFIKIEHYYFILMILILGITKSSQFPFNSWLPAAMAAPTPVSALVHSSTLVTSGLYIFMKFKMPLFNIFFKKSMLLLGLITMVLGSYSALLSKDIKKIIAFSTLSQLGFLMISFSSLWAGLMMFHLLSHAFLKSFFFILFGFSIMMMFSQNFFKITMSFKMFYKMTMFYIMFLNFSSFFFTCLFFSKEILIYMSMMNKIFFLIMYLFTLIFTLLYMKRLYFILLSKKFCLLFSYKFFSNLLMLNIKYILIFNFFSLLWIMNMSKYYFFSNCFSLLMIMFLFFFFLNLNFMNLYFFLNYMNNLFSNQLLMFKIFMKEELFVYLMNFKYVYFLKIYFKKMSLFILFIILLSI